MVKVPQSKPAELPQGEFGATGRKLWDDITDEFDLESQELIVLIQACRIADVCEQLHEFLDEGLVDTDGNGNPAPNKLLVELRQQQIALARLMAALRIPVSDPHEEGRPQRR